MGNSPAYLLSIIREAIVTTPGGFNSRKRMLLMPSGLKHLDVVLFIERPNRGLDLHDDLELTLKLKLKPPPFRRRIVKRCVWFRTFTDLLERMALLRLRFLVLGRFGTSERLRGIRMLSKVRGIRSPETFTALLAIRQRLD